jgi:addiction module HigA family antidote
MPRPASLSGLEWSPGPFTCSDRQAAQSRGDHRLSLSRRIAYDPAAASRRNHQAGLGVTAVTALRLARCFGTIAEFWLNLQSLYDLRIAHYNAAGQIRREVKPLRSLEARTD